MSAKYREFTGLNLPAIEKEVLDRWSATQAFEQSISLREGATPFVFYEGPPSANGMPGRFKPVNSLYLALIAAKGPAFLAVKPMGAGF